MFAEGIFKQNVYGDIYPNVVKGKPASVNNLIFDVGFDVDYNYRIIIEHWTECRQKMFSTVVFFNKNMSFELYSVLGDEKYFKKTKPLFENRMENVLHGTGIAIHKLDPLHKYITNAKTLNTDLYDMLFVYFTLNTTYKSTKELLDLQK